MTKISDLATRLKKIRKDKNLRQIDLASSLGLAQTTIANYEQGTRFPNEKTLLKIANFFNVSLDFLLSRTDIRLNNEDIMYKDTSKRIEIYKNTKVSLLQKEYFNFVLNGDKQLATKLILDSARNELSVEDIYYYVLERSLKEAGRLWEMNIIDVYQEHYFSNITQQIMSRLYPYINTKERNGLSCVSLGVNGEFHNIGVRMITDCLEAEGWKTYFLGSDIPTQNVIRALQDRKANMIVISATMSFNLDAVSNLIKGVRSSRDCENVKIMVGGRAFDTDIQIWKSIDADGYASTFEEVIKIADELTTTKISLLQ
ncbi:cobalamin-dependent protein [Clostridium sp.]|uniref:cobalamin-dependent protein n=1 Tax=Clostridium sp. TaxID=1506 RepID=UPI003D6D5E8D